MGNEVPFIALIDDLMWVGGATGDEVVVAVRFVAPSITRPGLCRCCALLGL